MILSRPQLEEVVSQGLITASVKPVCVDLVSIGLHLDNQFVEYAEHPIEPFVPPKQLLTKAKNVAPDGAHVLVPQGKVLACSQEHIRMPNNLMGLIQTKGSLARGFLMVHMCDGQIDPGYEGKITFEIVNLSDFYYRLEPGMPIAQLFLVRLSAPVESTYDGRYQGSGTPTAMKERKNGNNHGV
jgi:dCTP deaminase